MDYGDEEFESFKKKVRNERARYNTTKTQEWLRRQEQHRMGNRSPSLSCFTNVWSPNEFQNFDEPLYKTEPLHNPNDPNDDFIIFWTPQELIVAAKVIKTHSAKQLYSLKNPIKVKKILYLILLTEKYNEILNELLEESKYFEKFPEDSPDENVVQLALFDILCRGNGITLEQSLQGSLRFDFKNCGLRVIYMELEKKKKWYYKQIHEKMEENGVRSVYRLLSIVVPIIHNLDFPKKFDVWINKNQLDKWEEDNKILEQIGLRKYGSTKNRDLTYKQIEKLPYFYELRMFNYCDFYESPHYLNQVLIPVERNHCLAVTETVKKLVHLNINHGTIIQTHILSLAATAYFAFLLGATSTPPMKLRIFGADKMKESFEYYFDQLNLKNIYVHRERFYIINPRHVDISDTPCVLVNPETTVVTNLDIVDETVTRGCDLGFLYSTYQWFYKNDVESEDFMYRYINDVKEMANYNIRVSLSIPKVQFIVYQSFSTEETPEDNIAQFVVTYESEIPHINLTAFSTLEDLTEVQKYKYCKKLELYFHQGNTQQNVISPRIWGSTPPFISMFYRIEPMLSDIEIEDKTANKPDSITSKSDKNIDIEMKSVLERRLQLRNKVNIENIGIYKEIETLDNDSSSNATLASAVTSTKSNVLFHMRQDSVDIRKVIDLEQSKNKAKLLVENVVTPVSSVKKKKILADKTMRTKKTIMNNLQVKNLKAIEYIPKTVKLAKKPLKSKNRYAKKKTKNETYEPKQISSFAPKENIIKVFRATDDLSNGDDNQSETSDINQKLNEYMRSTLSQREASTVSFKHPSSKLSDVLQRPSIRPLKVSYDFKKELRTSLADNEAMAKIMSWFERVESTLDLQENDQGKLFKLEEIHDKLKISKVAIKEEEEELLKQEDEGVANCYQELSPLRDDDNKIQHSPFQLIRLKMFEMGERDLEKIRNLEISLHVDEEMIKLEGYENDRKSLKELHELDKNEHIQALNKFIAEYKSGKYNLDNLSSTDESVKEDTNISEIGPIIQKKLLKTLYDHILVGGGRKVPDKIEVEDSRETKLFNIENATVEELNLKKEKLENEDILKKIYCRFSKKEMEKIRETVKMANQYEEEKKKKKKKKKRCRLKSRIRGPLKIQDQNLISFFDEEFSFNGDNILEMDKVIKAKEKPIDLKDGDLLDAIPDKTPTEGLSKLAKELYQIRDVVEYFLHHNVTPLDYRAVAEERENY